MKSMTLCRVAMINRDAAVRWCYARRTAESTIKTARYDERVNVIRSASETAARQKGRLGNNVAPPARPDLSLTLRVTAAFLLFFSTSAFAGIIGRDVDRELREHGSAHVIVMMRGTTIPALNSDIDPDCDERLRPGTGNDVHDMERSDKVCVGLPEHASIMAMCAGMRRRKDG